VDPRLNVICVPAGRSSVSRPSKSVSSTQLSFEAITQTGGCAAAEKVVNV
jgi:hypothetical protein